MRNVTVTLDEETALWARVEAAKRDQSLSAFIRDMLADSMRSTHEYRRAMKRYLSRKAVPLKKPGERYPTRDELYERGRLR